MGRQASAALEQRHTFISRAEAREQGLKFYFNGSLCHRKHNSQRYTTTGGCVECALNVGAVKTDNTVKELNRDKMRRPIAERLVLSGPEQALAVEAFAKAGSYEHAASALGLNVAQLKARRVANEAFDVAFKKLELRFNVFENVGPSATPDFEWTDAHRTTLVDRFIDTGDIAEARDSIGVSPSVYQRELEQNTEFAAMIKEAEPKAWKHLEERAIQLSLRGNDKLLTAVLKAKNPEYRDSLKLDVNTTVRNISNDELDRRIKRLSRGQIIDARFTEVKSLPEAGIAELAGGEAEAGSAKQDWDDVP
jgi:hypothetical protein